MDGDHKEVQWHPTEAAEEKPLFDVKRAKRSLKDLDVDAFGLALKFHIIPTIGTPVFIEVYFEKDFKKSLKARTKAYRLTGMGGYDQGEPDLYYEREVPSQVAMEIWNSFHHYSFWTQETELEDEVLDGTWYYIEAKQNDRFHRVVRQHPDQPREEGQESVQSLMHFRSLCEWIDDAVGVRPVRSVKAK